MATKKTTKKTVTAPKPARRKSTKRSRAAAAAVIDLPAPTSVGLEMKGESLTVKLSRERHPEVFDIDRLIKAMRQLRETYQNSRRMRDLCNFVAETEKSLEIILSNHLEDALRKYLR